MPFSLIDLKHMHTLVSHPCISFTARSLILFIIGTFLLKNYKQALSLLDTKPVVIAALTKVGASSGKVVEEWLREEEAYLCGRNPWKKLLRWSTTRCLRVSGSRS